MGVSQASSGGCADLVFECLHLTGRVPIFFAAADIEQEVGEQIFPAGCMDYFGVKLHGEEALGHVRHGSYRASIGASQQAEARRRLDHGIAVAHPHLLGMRQAFEEH